MPVCKQPVAKLSVPASVCCTPGSRCLAVEREVSYQELDSPSPCDSLPEVIPGRGEPSAERCRMRAVAEQHDQEEEDGWEPALIGCPNPVSS